MFNGTPTVEICIFDCVVVWSVCAMTHDLFSDLATHGVYDISYLYAKYIIIDILVMLLVILKL